MRLFWMAGSKTRALALIMLTNSAPPSCVTPSDEIFALSDGVLLGGGRGLSFASDLEKENVRVRECVLAGGVGGDVEDGPRRDFVFDFERSNNIGLEIALDLGLVFGVMLITL
jgi:hypothetical protein